MDEATTTAPEHEPTPPQGTDRWSLLRARRQQANTNRSAGELLDLGIDIVTAAGTYALIALGFTASYSTIRQIAVDKGAFSEGMSHIVPLSFEGGIIILSLRVLREARQGQRALFLRILVGLGAIATLVTNAHSKATDIAGQLTHVVPVAMFIICFEWMVHSARRKALVDMGLIPPPLPRLRSIEWGLDFFNSFARWRLMALHSTIATPDHAMWVRHALLIERARITEKYGKWRDAPRHVRLQMRVTVLAEGERRFARTAANGEPQPKSPYAALAAELERPAPVPELELPDVQTALPTGSTAATLPEGDTPQTVDSLADVEDGHDAAAWIGAQRSESGQRQEPVIETRDERERREEREDERAAQASADETYQRTVQLVYDAIKLGERISGPQIAKHHTVGVRTVQRHIRTMQETGLLPEDATPTSTN
ncbi:DUF2637 domain-containing protein [Streptomyces sp. H10-C2]|uniref:DUF2637 domain-containing protein n=1 Tax=Streptomyces sp. H10-C2 TaxID=3046210 RepID=UPI0024B9A7BA|nr:DUF2637 domain-containing protein [Streptomyces sp. H10-C2]MDJ0374763.1 DUF2637 domain-containing protein [Streptomyces sp. H10-C2]